MRRSEYAGPSSPEQVRLEQAVKNAGRRTEWQRRYHGLYCEFEAASRSEVVIVVVLAAALLSLLVGAAIGAIGGGQ